METKLKKIMNGKGISQAELARQSRVDVYRLNRYVTGAARPGPSTLKRLADALGVPSLEIKEVDRV